MLTVQETVLWRKRKETRELFVINAIGSKSNVRCFRRYFFGFRFDFSDKTETTINGKEKQQQHQLTD